MKHAMKRKSLQFRGHELSNTEKQLNTLSEALSHVALPPFEEKLASEGAEPLRSGAIDILQVNLGKMCNQVCAHCHVDAGPDRKEIMTQNTMQLCLEKLDEDKTNAKMSNEVSTVDMTGGAPEMNPHFRWFVQEVRKRNKKVMVRCNLTIILANPKYQDLPEFYRTHEIEVVSSLPHFSQTRTDAQRGEGVFEKSIQALKMLNNVGYGSDPKLALHLVYNPSGAFLPSSQKSLEQEFKAQLLRRFNIRFNQLLTITNMPISRFLDYLVASGNLKSYMQTLVQAFNPRTLNNVMCRNTLSVGWDGYLYDCDFNQMLNLRLGNGKALHLKDISLAELKHRRIRTHQHCFGCTAGAGSGCGGEIT